MNITKIAQYSKTGMTQTQTVNTVNRKHLSLLENKKIDEIILQKNNTTNEIGKEIGNYIGNLIAVWTGTFGAYTLPEKEFKRFVIYEDLITKIKYNVEVPPKLVGKKDAAFVVNHFVDLNGNPLFEYTTRGKKDILVKIYDEKKICILENFPREDGWYMTDENKIPAGKKVDPDTDTTIKKIDGKPISNITGKLVNKMSGKYSDNEMIAWYPNARRLEQYDDLSYVGLISRRDHLLKYDVNFGAELCLTLGAWAQEKEKTVLLPNIAPKHTWGM